MKKTLFILLFHLWQGEAFAQLCFNPSVNFSAGANPISVTSADFNGDGKLDLATSNNFSNNVAVLLGTGNGNFGVATTFTIGAQASAITHADLNGDGNTDLAIVSPSSSIVSVILGNGSGGFGPASYFTVGGLPGAILSTDFNGDGFADLATANSASNVSILLGTGTGSFSAVTNYAVASWPTSLIYGDFNTDGKVDLVTGNFSSCTVSLLLGTGTGTFGSASNFPAGPNGTMGPNCICSGDFDLDGTLDLAAGNDSISNVVWVLLGTGTGNFSNAISYSVDSTARSIISADFNEDCSPDLATANSGSNNVSILLGAGNGSFGSFVNYTPGNSRITIISDDFNGDGKEDIATANGTDVSVLINCSNFECLNTINELKKEENIFVYPNPSTGEISIENVFADAYLHVSDINGKLVREIKLNGSETTKKVNLSMLDNGVYFYSLISRGDHRQGKIIILK